MTCNEYQDRLAECLGQPELPADLAAHVSDCTDCASVWEELKQIGGHLGSDSAFYPEPHEAELVAQVVEREIRAAEHGAKVIRPHWWTRVAQVAAAAVVIVGAVTVTWKFTHQPGTGGDTATSSQFADTSQFSAQDDTEELSSDVIRLLLYDVSTTDNFRASEVLLNDISDEEAAYLRTSLKAGDLL
ncbi:MAG: hypothetical protein HY851_02415 [candidate division Zixibacteria bacterium]|nr:hypothetical protein [candidate division Zixibacteria bacterium]